MNQSLPRKLSTISGTGERRAVIEIGTNAVKLLVADLAGTLCPLMKLSRQTRLGQGAFRTGYLSLDAVARTAEVVAEFAVRAAELNPTSLRVLATCAAREARNGDELVQAVRRIANVPVEIISGEQEAKYVFQGVTSDSQFARRPVLIVDVGGGSTEWIVGEAGATCFDRSTRLGTTRLLDVLIPADPPTANDLAHCRQTVSDFLQQEVHPELSSVLKSKSFGGRTVSLVGLGGALKTLTRLSAARPVAGSGEPLRLGLANASEQIERLWSLSAQERRQLPGLDPEKADVILTGAVIYEMAMRQFGYQELFVSRWGLREGAILTSPVS